MKLRVAAAGLLVLFAACPGCHAEQDVRRSHGSAAALHAPAPLEFDLPVVTAAQTQDKATRQQQRALLKHELPTGGNAAGALNVVQHRRAEEAAEGVQTAKAKEAPAGTSSGKGQFSVQVETLFATLWICLIASFPALLIVVSHKRLTRTEIIEGALVLVWLAAGIFLFTNIIKFNSAHWDGAQTLTIVQAVYLLTQIVTTIGYGDITPAYPRGMVVIAIYIFFSVILIANLISQTVEAVQARLALLRERLATRVKTTADTQVQRRGGWAALDHFLNGLFHREMRGDREVSYRPMIMALLFYLLCMLVGSAFFHWFPGEGKTWFEAIYMTIVTMSTVGFGAFTAVTPGGMVFSAFWMLVGVSSFGNLMTKCIELSLMHKIAEGWDSDGKV